MYPNRKTNPEVRPQPERRRFSADYKRRTVIEADQCRHGEMGAHMDARPIPCLLIQRAAGFDQRQRPS